MSLQICETKKYYVQHTLSQGTTGRGASVK